MATGVLGSSQSDVYVEKWQRFPIEMSRNWFLENISNANPLTEQSTAKLEPQNRPASTVIEKNYRKIITFTPENNYIYGNFRENNCPPLVVFRGIERAGETPMSS